MSRKFGRLLSPFTPALCDRSARELQQDYCGEAIGYDSEG